MRVRQALARPLQAPIKKLLVRDYLVPRSAKKLHVPGSFVMEMLL